MPRPVPVFPAKKSQTTHAVRREAKPMEGERVGAGGGRWWSSRILSVPDYIQPNVRIYTTKPCKCTTACLSCLSPVQNCLSVTAYERKMSFHQCRREKCCLPYIWGGACFAHHHACPCPCPVKSVSCFLSCPCLSLFSLSLCHSACSPPSRPLSHESCRLCPTYKCKVLKIHEGL